MKLDVSKKHKLIIEEKETNFLTPNVPKFTFNKGETKPFIKDFDKIVASIWKLNKIGPKILIFAWAGYYLEYLKDSLEKLLNSGSRICLVIVGDYLKPEELNYYQSKGILTFYKSEWELKDEIILKVSSVKAATLLPYGRENSVPSSFFIRISFLRIFSKFLEIIS